MKFELLYILRFSVWQRMAHAGDFSSRALSLACKVTRMIKYILHNMFNSLMKHLGWEENNRFALLKVILTPVFCVLTLVWDTLNWTETSQIILTTFIFHFTTADRFGRQYLKTEFLNVSFQFIPNISEYLGILSKILYFYSSQYRILHHFI